MSTTTSAILSLDSHQPEAVVDLRDTPQRTIDVLLVHSEAGARSAPRPSLEGQSYEVRHAHSSAEAVRILRQSRPALALVEVSVGGLAGLDSVRALREASDVPIIVLTDRAEDSTRYLSLELGADDCVTARCSPRELQARIRAVIRRCRREPQRETRIEVGNVSVDAVTRAVFVGGQPIVLSAKELGLLIALTENVGATCTHRDLLRSAWAIPQEAGTASLRVHIAWLRGKLRASNVRIDTDWGVGYRLVVHGQPEDSGTMAIMQPSLRE